MVGGGEEEGGVVTDRLVRINLAICIQMVKGDERS